MLQATTGDLFFQKSAISCLLSQSSNHHGFPMEYIIMQELIPFQLNRNERSWFFSATATPFCLTWSRFLPEFIKVRSHRWIPLPLGMRHSLSKAISILRRSSLVDTRADLRSGAWRLDILASDSVTFQGANLICFMRFLWARLGLSEPLGPCGFASVSSLALFPNFGVYRRWMSIVIWIGSVAGKETQPGGATP